ncbi:hypothetical protein NLM33_25025 [Bradyrhizobium sp. CCGUVB1N3]|uniref:hypothetical protein n=1 Tax=Bradyrhizobium sp. CCGUVB1N3 TaxID=2949629 RepID=UPI0020B2F261|nr:hypothetical protein [Bradyrhizobium sp. CCGUVB1N3]MCP3471799.1 hypothetical protein [Bradyrhizobium sp. CCGUVB1N3]MCP3473581.1 hypothetical protein [Bradyrhizobium sp. CCGUVB1N3]
MTTETPLSRLMNDALAAVAHPGQTLTRVCDMLRPKSGYKLPAGRKLTDDQAAAAALVVTRIADRLGLSCSAICQTANIARDPKNFYRFHLTREERESGQTRFAAGRFNKTLVRYRDLVVAAAALAECDQLPLLDELAVAVQDFLEPYVPLARRDEFEELAEGLAEIGRYLSRPRKAADGTIIDLSRLWAACDQRRLEFDEPTGQLEYRGEDPEFSWYLTWPRIFLFPRVVGHAEVECSENDGSDILEHTLQSLKNRSRPIGKVKAKLCYAVHLAVGPSRARGRAKALLLLESWTLLASGPRSTSDKGWPNPAAGIWCPGFPFSASSGTDEHGTFDFIATGPTSPTCPEFRDWFDGADFEDPMVCEQTMRAVDITPEILELMLRHESSPPGWDFFGRWSGRSALPSSVEMPGGVPSESLLDRLRDALYRDDEKALDGQLLTSAAPMMNALDRLLESSDDEMTRRRATFMRRMRS